MIVGIPFDLGVQLNQAFYLWTWNFEQLFQKEEPFTQYVDGLAGAQFPSIVFPFKKEAKGFLAL